MSRADDASTLQYITESVLALIDGLPEDEPLGTTQEVVLMVWMDTVSRFAVPDGWHNLQLHAYQLLGSLLYWGTVIPPIRAKADYLRQMLVGLTSES